jgi:hypothetical protein
MINDMQTTTPGPGQGQYLRFECGSVYPDMMFRKSSNIGSGSRYRKKMCPKCGAESINKIFYCVDCEKWFIGTKSTSHKKIRCKSCADDRKRIARAAARRCRDKSIPRPTRKYTYKELKKIPPVKPDCKFYLSECLPRAAFKPGGRGRVHCENCIYYEQKTMHAKIITKNCETYNYNLTP